MTNILKIAHRGASGYAPENTLAAFKKAIELGADMIELDVHLTKDQELVVMHDETVNRTTDGKGKISKKILTEIKKLLINGHERVPTLQEVINLVKGQCRLNIEIKNKGAAKNVLEIIKKNCVEQTTMVSSNYLRPLREVYKNNKNIEIALIFWSSKTKFRQLLIIALGLLLFPFTCLIILRRARRARACWVNLAWPFAHKRFVRLLHTFNYNVAVWIVNNPRLIKKMKEMGVDGIMSNYPDRL